MLIHLFWLLLFIYFCLVWYLTQSPGCHSDIRNNGGNTTCENIHVNFKYKYYVFFLYLSNNGQDTQTFFCLFKRWNNFLLIIPSQSWNDDVFVSRCAFRNFFHSFFFPFQRWNVTNQHEIEDASVLVLWTLHLVLAAFGSPASPRWSSSVTNLLHFRNVFENRIGRLFVFGRERQKKWESDAGSLFFYSCLWYYKANCSGRLVMADRFSSQVGRKTPKKLDHSFFRRPTSVIKYILVDEMYFIFQIQAFRNQKSAKSNDLAEQLIQKLKSRV